MASGLNIYKGFVDATNTDTFVFDWDANFTIGFLLSLINDFFMSFLKQLLTPFVEFDDDKRRSRQNKKTAQSPSATDLQYQMKGQSIL